MRRFLRQRVPTGVHPLVRRLFELMNEQQCGVLDLADRSGITQSAIRHWRASSQEKRSKTPGIGPFDAVINALGYRLEIVPSEDDFKPEVREVIAAWKRDGMTPMDAAMGIGLDAMTWYDVERLLTRKASVAKSIARRKMEALHGKERD